MFFGSRADRRSRRLSSFLVSVALASVSNGCFDASDASTTDSGVTATADDGRSSHASATIGVAADAATDVVADATKDVALDAGVANRPTPPNILLILQDDYGAESSPLYPDLNGDTGAVPTPNLQALAEQGVVFD